MSGGTFKVESLQLNSQISRPKLTWGIFSCSFHVRSMLWMLWRDDWLWRQDRVRTRQWLRRARANTGSATLSTVHLVMRHNHNSVSAFIILEILIRKEELNRLAEGVLKTSLAYVLFWLLLTDSTLSRWSAEQKPRHLPKRNLVSTTSTQYFYFDHPHTLRSLHLQQPTTNMG